MTMTLHFSLGPVQGFVGQSRRTRDLWGSSFLVSYLSGQAMHAVRSCAEGNTIVLPVIDEDPLLQHIATSSSGPLPRMGSLPNRFQARVADVKAAAGAAIAAIEGAWQQLCRTVWEQFVAPVAAEGRGTRAIWDRQVKDFWEIQWAAGDGLDLLDRRKNWRTHLHPEEPGRKCTVIGHLQELSGAVRHREQRRFWDAFQAQDRVGLLDLRPDERLSAIALIKRFWPRTTGAVQGTVNSQHWPSTAFMAAIPWVSQVGGEQPDKAKAYADQVKAVAAAGALGERATHIASLSLLAAGDFPNLDGNFFFEHALRNEKLTPLLDEALREDLLHQLDALSGRDGSGPNPFLGLLLMDGDRLGALLRELGSDDVSHALASFTRRVPKIVRQHDGVTVYAGGDDVLALLPATGALDCSEALEVAYRSAFSDIPLATLSGGLVLAHFRTPLRTLLAEAHELLDDAAKDGNGRSSLAVSLLKGSGRAARWVSAWERPDEGRAVAALAALQERLGAEREGALSSSFIYRLRDELALLARTPWEPGQALALVEGFEPTPFLLAEYLRTQPADCDREQAEGDVEALVSMLEWVHCDDARRPVRRSHELLPDVLLLARFLSGGAPNAD